MLADSFVVGKIYSITNPRIMIKSLPDDVVDAKSATVRIPVDGQRSYEVVLEMPVKIKQWKAYGGYFFIYPRDRKARKILRTFTRRIAYVKLHPGVVATAVRADVDFSTLVVPPKLTRCMDKLVYAVAFFGGVMPFSTAELARALMCSKSTIKVAKEHAVEAGLLEERDFFLALTEAGRRYLSRL